MSKPLGRRDLLAMSPLLAASNSAAASSNPLDTVRGRVSPGNGRFMMPAHFGPLANPGPGEYKGGGGGTMYRDVSQIFVTYLTDAQMLSRFLPEPYELSGEPLVTVNYSRNREIDWLAGGSYNIVGVFVPATYRGKQDQVSGSYALVLWENLTDPILTGREAQGIPKIYGDIEDHQVSGDSWRTSLSRNSHKILDLRASAMKPLASDQLRDLEKSFQNSQMLGWKYVPNETFTGAVLSYATAFPTAMSFRQAWTAQGSVEWCKQTWSQNPTQAHIVNAMQSLPVKEIRSCLVTTGTVSLLSSNVRRLV
jgi:acetoacetate decarboxylase